MSRRKQRGRGLKPPRIWQAPARAPAAAGRAPGGGPSVSDILMSHGLGEPLPGTAPAPAPIDADRLLNEGRRRHEAGDLDGAEQCYGRVVELHPGHVLALHELGHVVLEKGEAGRAVVLFERALAAPPAPLLHLSLGKALQKAGRLNEAVSAYREASRLAPGFAEAHCDLGLALVHQDLAEDAERAFRQALAIRPDYVRALNHLGLILETRGDFDGARAAFGRALEIDPDYRFALYNLVQLKTYRQGDPDFEVLERRRAELSLDDRARTGFALGKMYVDLGEHKRAFAEYRRGNEAKREFLRERGEATDVVAFARFVDRMIEVCSADFLARRPGFGADSEVPVFIVGMPRSGSTLIEQILSNHPLLESAGEAIDHWPQVIAEIARELAAPYPDCLERLTGEMAGRHGARYLDVLRQRFAHASRVANKVLGMFQHLGLIAVLLPKARIIHCRRDPRDVCLSCYFNDFSAGLSYTYDLRELGQFYRQYERLMAHWHSVMPARMLTVNYEELIEEQEVVSRRLIEFCGLNWDRRCLDFHTNPRPVFTGSVRQVRQRIYRSSMGRWQPYAEQLRPLFDALDLDAE